MPPKSSKSSKLCGSCGVEISRFTCKDSPDWPPKVFLGGKRDSLGHGGVEFDREWRRPKRVERIPGNGNVPERVRLRSNLPICYGIDGLDGGSPLLFTSRASIKSSSEMISGFLSSDVMHGVGNLLTHLTIIGYKVSYQQRPDLKTLSVKRLSLRPKHLETDSCAQSKPLLRVRTFSSVENSLPVAENYAPSSSLKSKDGIVSL
ncbi:Calponin homology domain-containing protein [Artemisia annua]|uniref:Calponin homology domain-containing protein n=1 Tax=Artemisia annua TaxID=35608 RepID=A0A2U1NV85_ARTAN|nr:Calponin homology domain-containing protein [Artemisia annua]